MWYLRWIIGFSVCMEILENTINIEMSGLILQKKKSLNIMFA